MQKRKFLGTVDRDCDHIAFCEVANDMGPNTQEVWYNPEYLENWGATDYQQLAKRVKAQSHGRLYLGFKNIQAGLITINEDPACPITNNYNMDRAIADVAGELLLKTKESVAI